MLHITNESFDKIISETEKPILIDFHAEWCVPCKMMTPILNQLEAERDDIVFAELDIDEATEIAIRYGIMSIPAFLLIKDGEKAAMTVGYMSADDLLSELGL